MAFRLLYHLGRYGRGEKVRDIPESLRTSEANKAKGDRRRSLSARIKEPAKLSAARLDLNRAESRKLKKVIFACWDKLADKSALGHIDAADRSSTERINRAHFNNQRRSFAA
jgi:hypothetical protein